MLIPRPRKLLEKTNMKLKQKEIATAKLFKWYRENGVKANHLNIILSPVLT